jgi:hypothetical protein
MTKGATAMTFSTTRIVPHFGLCVLMLVFAISVSFFLHEVGLSSLLVSENVACSVIDHYIENDHRIGLNVECDHLRTRVDEPAVVVDALERHAQMLSCARLYANSALTGCAVVLTSQSAP